MPLTTTDTAVLKYIRAYVALNGHSPTYREVASACHLKTISRVKRNLERLEAAGLLTFTRGTSGRGISLIEKERAES